MEISRQLMVGETISYAKNEIVASIEKGDFPSKINWHAITTAFEEDNLFYILSGVEYRHPMYHMQKEEKMESSSSEEKELRLIGIAGSKKEATELIRDLIISLLKKNTPGELKQILNHW